MRLFPVPLVLAVAILSWPAQAETFGKIDAVSAGQDVPKGIGIAVLPDADDMQLVQDPLYRAAREGVLAALQNRGMTVSGAGSLTLRIIVHQPSFGGDAPPERHAPPAPKHPTVPEVVDQFAIPLQPRTRDAGSSVSMYLMLYAADGKVLWVADSSASGRIAEPGRIVRRLSEAAASDIGANVKRSFLLGCGEQSRQEPGLCLD